MTVFEYLQAKYQQKQPTIMSAVEARVFGLRYPLEPGWAKTIEGRVVTPEIEKRLKRALLDDARHKERLARKKAKKFKSTEGVYRRLNSIDSAISVLDAAHITLTKTVDPASDAFLQSKQWKRLRYMAIQKYGRKCQCCGATPESGAIMNVDHIKPRRLFPQLATEMSNLQILCGDCNEAKGNWDMTDWRTPDLSREASR